MKILYSCVLILAVIVASQAYSASWGRRNSSDFLLSRQTEKRAPLKNSYWDIIIDFPRPGTPNYYNITYINVVDNFRNSSGAAPYLRAGGPGYRYAKINLRSQTSRGVDSTVEIWGRY